MSLKASSKAEILTPDAHHEKVWDWFSAIGDHDQFWKIMNHPICPHFFVVSVPVPPRVFSYQVQVLLHCTWYSLRDIVPEHLSITGVFRESSSGHRYKFRHRNCSMFKSYMCSVFFNRHDVFFPLSFVGERTTNTRSWYRLIQDKIYNEIRKFHHK